MYAPYLLLWLRHSTDVISANKHLKQTLIEMRSLKDNDKELLEVLIYILAFGCFDQVRHNQSVQPDKLAGVFKYH